LTAAAIDAARGPLPRPVKVEGVADDLGAHAERPRDQVDARSRLGHLDDLRQHDFVFWGFPERNGRLVGAESCRAGYYPTVTM
jgi:hypothetical protein